MTAWRLVFLMICLFFGALLAFGQAITFVWFSAFPERVSQLQSLAIKAWSLMAIAAILVIIDLALLVHLIRQVNKRNRRLNMKADSGLDED